MQPHQYALAAGVIWLVTLTILPFLIATARRRAYALGFEAGKVYSDQTLNLQLKEARQSLELLRADNTHVAKHAKNPADAQVLQVNHRQTLLEIAETLRVAAETWSAFKTGKKLERDAIRLRGKALVIATALSPAGTAMKLVQRQETVA
ncbi:hypothetical protein [Pseudomonas shirazensis]|uniref:hypothetical protein n=1 Tax=Pseudomonas shirazensis TaxID=2745494 RepID=UPI0016485544|nr:hypothetical protein [Pseudomonas shirazensis]MBV4500765.1 hypothetical protein [Pseudomonas shirazensis]